MAKTLILTSSPKSNAVSTFLAAEFANMLVPQEIEIFDISTIDFPIYDEALLHKFDGEASAFAPDSNFYDDVMRQFIAAQQIVFAFPNWNGMCPPSLVYYMLCVCRAGVTFMYTEKGPKGLLQDKKALLILSNGGKYVENETCFGVSWLKATLQMNGITQIDTVIAEKLDMLPEKSEEYIQNALNELREIAKSFQQESLEF